MVKIRRYNKVGVKMTVKDIYLVTTDTQPIQILSRRVIKTIYVGCAKDIPNCMLERNVNKISQSMYALVLFVD